MNHRTRLLQAAIALASRSTATTYEAQLQASEKSALHLLKRAYRQSAAAMRLLRWSEAHLDSPHRQS